MATSDKLERLVNLVAALLHTGVPLSAETIRERVAGYTGGDAAFHRQFSRDKEDLREMGVPIRVELVPDTNEPVEGYRILPAEYYLPDPGLEADELAALHLATRLVTVDVDTPSAGLYKLGGLAGVANPGGPPRAEVPTPPGLAALFDAVTAPHRVSFSYRDRSRTLVPRRLGFQQGNWYVSGWDDDAGADRLYRVDRIEGPITVSSEAVHEMPEAASDIGPLESWSIGGDEPFETRIRVDALSRPSITARFGEDRIVSTDETGGAVFAFEVTNAEGFITWILGYSDTVEIIEPAQLRTALVERLRAAASGDEP